MGDVIDSSDLFNGRRMDFAKASEFFEIPQDHPALKKLAVILMGHLMAEDLTDEIIEKRESLEAEIARLLEELAAFRGQVFEGDNIIRRLLDRAGKAEADTARLDWMQANGMEIECFLRSDKSGLDWQCDNGPLVGVGSLLREAIDAARSVEGE